jgi:cobalt-zinc-cadmium resistance protein CzcA
MPNGSKTRLSQDSRGFTVVIFEQSAQPTPTTGHVGLLVLAVFVFSRLGAEFVPQLDEGSFATHMIRTTSIGIDASVEMQKQGEKVLLEKFPEVAYTFSRLGTAEIASDPMGVNVADTYIMFNPIENWRKVNGKPIGKEELATLMTEELGKYLPGEGHLFSQPIEMRFNEILESTRADIAVKVFGEDFAVIEKVASEAREILEQIRGASDVEFDALGKSPLLEIVPKREAMSKYKIHAAELNNVVHAALAGQEVGKLIEGNRRFDIVVRLSEELREKIDDLKRLPVRVEEVRVEETLIINSGARVPLDGEVTSGESAINQARGVKKLIRRNPLSDSQLAINWLWIILCGCPGRRCWRS